MGLVEQAAEQVQATNVAGVDRGLTPGVSGGFFPGEVNVVDRNAIGQCASPV